MTGMMLIGPIGRQVSIPQPESGMSFDSIRQTDTTQLLSGGVSVYTAPTTHKTFSMNWKGGLHHGKALQPLADLYTGMYGVGPYYITDPTATDQNLLPTRWASSYQLSYLAGGWANAVLMNQNVTPEGQGSRLSYNEDYPAEGPSLAVPAVPGKPLYLKAWGTASGGAGIRVYRHSVKTGLWTLDMTVTPQLEMVAPTQVVIGGGEFDAVRLVLYVPAGGAMNIHHIDLSPTDYAGKYRGGTGVGAVQFSGNLGGSLVSKVIDRIGLTVDLTEVERDANFS